MCGIAGIVSNECNINVSEFAVAVDALAHRGPDDEGYALIIDNRELIHARGNETNPYFSYLPNIGDYEKAYAVFGHRRLSIIGIGEEGHQPFTKYGYTLTYNGEIFNYVELRNQLIGFGYNFDTETDTEVFITAYHHWGEGAFKRFNGMWAAAIFSNTDQSLILSRDRFGIKPLYYCFHDNKLFFASEIKFFKALKLMGDVNEEAVYNYLRHSITDYDTSTFFKDIISFEPGTYAVYKHNHLVHETYWGDFDLGNIKHPADKVEKTLEDAVNIRLRSDVKIGSLLSGGIDSSLIVALVNKKIGLSTFSSFSAIFEDSEISERKYIEKTAEKLTFKPTYIEPNHADVSENIQKLLYIQEQPFRSLAVFSQHKIYEFVSQNTDIKVLLNGQGADETWTGYTEHYAYFLASIIGKLQLLKFFKEFSFIRRRLEMGRIQLFIWIFKTLLSAHINISKKNKIFKKKLISKKAFNLLGNKSLLQGKLRDSVNRSPLREYLRYEDRNSMYFGLEARLPFLDYRLVQLGSSYTEEELVKNGILKSQLREIARQYLPVEVVDRKDKAGFPSPQREWQKNQLADMFDAVFDQIKKDGIFDFIDEQEVLNIYKSYHAGEFEDWSFIWRVYCLYHWKQVWFG